MVFGKAPESHVQDGKKLPLSAPCGKATASGDPAMTIKSLRLYGRDYGPTRIVRKRHRFPDSFITNATRRPFGSARMQPAFAATSTGDAAKPADCKNARRSV